MLSKRLSSEKSVTHGLFEVLMGFTLSEECSRCLASDFQRRTDACLTHDGVPWDYPIKHEFVIFAISSLSRRGFLIKLRVQNPCLVFWEAGVWKHTPTAQPSLISNTHYGDSRDCGSMCPQTHLYKTLLFLSSPVFQLCNKLTALLKQNKTTSFCFQNNDK